MLHNAAVGAAATQRYVALSALAQLRSLTPESAERLARATVAAVPGDGPVEAQVKALLGHLSVGILGGVAGLQGALQRAPGPTDPAQLASLVPVVEGVRAAMAIPEPMPEVPGVRFMVDQSEITPEEERAYRLRTRDELAKLRAFVNEHFSDLKPYTGLLRLMVYDYEPPIASTSMTVWGVRDTPEKRQRVYLVPVARIRDGRLPNIHEMTHMLLPNQSRFLFEALAVWVEQTIGRLQAFPTYDKTINANLKPLLAGLGVKLDRFDAIATPHSIEDLGAGLNFPPGIPDIEKRRITYLICGSFAQFVIDKYGFQRFKQLYALTPLVPLRNDTGGFDIGRYQSVFGKPLAALQAEWEAWVLSSSTSTSN